jgi:hypothetical protein
MVSPVHKSVTTRSLLQATRTTSTKTHLLALSEVHAQGKYFPFSKWSMLMSSLNAAANHGFLSRDGIVTFNELVQAQQNVYNVGYDLAVVLATLVSLSSF